MIHLQLTSEEETRLIALAEQFNKELEDRNTPPFPKAATLSALKTELNAALQAQTGFDEIWQRSQSNAETLYLYHERTDIRNLPWQTATAERPLLTIAKTPVGKLTEHQPSVGFPLKVLVMVASPEGVTRLAYEDEELQLLRAFSPLMAQGLAEVHFTDDGSLENLEEKLSQNRYHILHFSGHGSYHEGKGILALEDPMTGRMKTATSEQFNQVLAKVARKGHRPDLVVLSACQTAQGIEAGNLAGVADTLLTGGTSAVIAMSASVLDTCATLFAAKLYAELSDGFPLPAAFQDAREAVHDYEKTLDLAKHGLAPAQWLIPQLLLYQKVEGLVNTDAPKTVLNLQQNADIIAGEQALVHLRVRPENYVFVGRRREKRIALRQLQTGKSILLRGQGGVGKTALAEHLAIRLLAGNPRHKVFTFSEKTPAAQSLLDQMQNYLTKEKKEFSIVSELAAIPKQTDKFYHLLGKISAHCDPVFIFDNMETFQKYDAQQAAWLWHREKHEDVFEVMSILDQQTPFPLIITGRYPLAEFPELEVCNMNTVPFADFFRKCHQLKIRDFAQKIQTEAFLADTLKRSDNEQAPTFEDVAKLLHKTFGGNYRALEFFDELYAQKGADIAQTLRKLSDFEAALQQDDIKEGVLTQMSENLIFEELLGYLNTREKDTLYVLAQYNIPVLPMAVGMQRKADDRSDDLRKVTELTLVEAQTGLDGRERFYVMPLVRDLLKRQEMDLVFDEKVAGDYHKYVVDSIITEDVLAELVEAFERYFTAKAISEINEVGYIICKYYYDVEQFRLSLAFGLCTEEVAREETHGVIWNNLGLIFQLFGKLELALTYLKKSLSDVKKREDFRNEATTLGNIGQIYIFKSNYERALTYLQKALKISRETDNNEIEGTTLNNLGQLYQNKSDYDSALDYYKQALKIIMKNGEREGEAVILGNVSSIHKIKGDYDSALNYLEQALKINLEINNLKGQGITLSNISQIYFIKGNYNKALDYSEQSLKIRLEIGDRAGEGTTLNNIGQIYHYKGDYECALNYLEQALKISREIGIPRTIGTTLSNIGEVYDSKGDYDIALDYLEQGLNISRKTGDINGVASTLTKIGGIFYKQKKYEDAIPMLFPAYQIFEKIGSPNKQGIEQGLDLIHQKIGKSRFDKILKNLINQNKNHV